MLSNQAIRSICAAVAIAAVGIAYNLRPPATVDPLTRAMELCGDTPAPVDYQRVGEGRFAQSVPIEPQQTPYALAVKSVDDCRAKVLDHFKGRDP